MAIQADTSRVQYTGNASTTQAYPVPFLFFSTTHLRCIVTTNGVDAPMNFVATGEGNPNGGSLTTVTAVPATSTVTIYREVPATQTTSYVEGSDFPAASHERALDKLTMLVQQIMGTLKRTVRVAQSSGETQEIPQIAGANKLLGTDGNGDLGVYDRTTVAVGSTTTGAAGSNAQVTNTGTATSPVLEFSIPGSPTVNAGTTTTTAPGTQASVTAAGTAFARQFNFSIPRGDKGETGLQGLTGPQGGLLNWRGNWSNATAYAVNDVVNHNGALYFATASNTNVTPTNTSHWQPAGTALPTWEKLNESGVSLLTDGKYLSNVWDALGNLTDTSGEVAIASWGDSVSAGKVKLINEELQRIYGKRGIAFDACGYTNSGGATVVTDFTRWPFRIFTLTGSGQSHNFTDFITSAYDAVLCNELTVFYVREPGAGTFTVEAENDASAAYTTLSGFASIDTSNTTLAGGFTKVAIPLGSYRFRISWVSGTVRILGIRARNTATGGIMNIQLGYSGQALESMNTAPSAVVAPILAELNPTVEVLEMKDSLNNWQTALENHHAIASAAVPSMSFLLVGSNPNGPTQNDSNQVSANATTKAVASNLHAAYWDGYAVYGSGAEMVARQWYLNNDDVHPNSIANQYAAARMLNDLGWSRVFSGLRRTGKMWVSDANTSQPWRFINRAGASNLQIIGQPSFHKRLQFANPSGTVVSSISALPSSGNNADGMILSGAGTNMLLANGKARIGSSINTSVALDAALQIEAGRFQMQGAIRNAASENITPTNGELWHDNARQALTMHTKGLSQRIGGVIFVGTQSVTLQNTTNQGGLIPSQGVGTTTLPGAWFMAGRSLTVEASGVYSTHTSDTNITMLLRLGGANIANTGAKALPASIVNGAWRYRAFCTCLQEGGPSTGQIYVYCEYYFDNGQGGITFALCPSAVTLFDSYSPLVLPGPRLTWSTAYNANSITCLQYIATSQG